MISQKYIVSKASVFTIILFVVLPLYSVPFIMYNMLRLHKWAFVLWALFMGLLGILVPPTGDFYRYTMDFYEFRSCTWEQFWFLALLKQDIMLPLVSYCIGFLDLNFDLSRFIYNFLGYYLLGSLFLEIVKNNSNFQYRYSLIYALGFFLAFTLTSFCYRYYFSKILFIYGAYYIVYKERKSGWIFVTLAVFNHLSYIIQGVILILQRFGFFRFGRKTVIVMIIGALLLDSNLVLKVVGFIPGDFFTHYMIYLDGHWAGDYLEDYSWKFRLMNFMSNVTVYAYVLIYIFVYDRLDKKKSSFVNSLLFLSLISVPFAVIQGRFLSVLNDSLRVSFLKCYDGTKVMYKYISILFWFTILSNIMGLWAFRRQFQISDFQKLAYSSSISILNHTYDLKWIDKNIDENGGLMKLNH